MGDYRRMEEEEVGMRYGEEDREREFKMDYFLVRRSMIYNLTKRGRLC